MWKIVGIGNIYNCDKREKLPKTMKKSEIGSKTAAPGARSHQKQEEQ